ncbi:MAG TPA: M20/M25/M40 family metallo-hydrolase [Nitrospiria bacterium]|nr:M20/M25/M40 family metallo-hydrolase [Nitrospiria bacterium]
MNKERLIALFLELVKIDSHSRREGKIAARLAGILKEMGASVSIDGAGAVVGGETGNVIGIFKGDPSLPPILLSAHMDTVAPGEGVCPVVEGGRIRTDGKTVLGGDDKSGIAIIIEGVRKILEEDLPHGDIEVVFTICEEAGLLGAKHLETEGFRSRYGLVLDSDDAGFLFTRAPSAVRLEFVVRGVAAHAGMAPEKGLSAIQIASRAISGMKLGRIDFETTANLGVIQGGTAVNIVPDQVMVEGEARSHDEEKLARQVSHMTGCFESAVSAASIVIDGHAAGASLEKKITKDYERMHLPDDSRIVRLVLRAAEQRGLSVKTKEMGGGCDANIFNRRGFEVANLGTGMRNIHSVSEYLLVDEFLQTAEVVFQTLVLNGREGVL